jgi:hypothetical protein
MPRNQTPAEIPPLAQPAELPSPAAELAREKQEVLRLRDLLIARDAELGNALGQLAERDARSLRLLARAEKLTPSFIWKRVEGLLGPRG